MLSYINNSEKKGTFDVYFKKTKKNEIFVVKKAIICEYGKNLIEIL
jgi:hypothetical protein